MQGTFPDGATTQAGDPNSSRNVSIGVGLAVAFLLVIAIVVTVVVIVVVVVKISRSSKRYIVNGKYT